MPRKSKRVPANVFIGTSGYSYGEWREVFYPKGTPSAGYLSYYAEKFPAVEINSSFYNLPRATTIDKWMTQVPPAFKFCLKLSRYITHMKKLVQPEEALERFFINISALQNHMGPVLVQLPASLHFKKYKCEHFCKVLAEQYPEFDFAIEPRHASWFTDESLDMLRKANIAFVISEAGDNFVGFEAVTSKHVYIRFHGPDKLYYSSHSNEQLRSYAKKIKAWSKAGHTCWVFFNNTAGINALNNAETLRRFLLE